MSCLINWLGTSCVQIKAPQKILALNLESAKGRPKSAAEAGVSPRRIEANAS
jgi:hypothetical protein